MFHDIGKERPPVWEKFQTDNVSPNFMRLGVNLPASQEGINAVKGLLLEVCFIFFTGEC